MLRTLAGFQKDSSGNLLFTAILGELGNNCFDHNLGKWKDIPGCYFAYGQETANLWGIVVDRGQGVLSSLRQAVPEIKDDDEALEMAFYRKLSGRSPEKRGNGLKFVRSVINGNKQRGLFFKSGKAFKVFGGLQKEVEALYSDILLEEVDQGAFAFALFRGLP